MTRTRRLALGSVAVGLVVLGLKWVAYRLTGSIALYSDALETIINVVAAGTAVWAIHVSGQPADAGHPYGHAKAEYLSAVFEGVLIVLAALSILTEAWHSAQAPKPLQAPVAGLAVNALASVLNGAWATVLVRYGRQWRSAALIADGHHLYSDVISSVGVLVGVGLVFLTGWLILDSVVAALAALAIIRSGWLLIRGSIDGLMDAAPPPEIVDRIRRVIGAASDGVLETHDLRTRLAGHATFVEFHLVVPGRMSVDEAHAICDRLELAIEQEISGARVTIHVEPESKAEHPAH